MRIVTCKVENDLEREHQSGRGHGIFCGTAAVPNGKLRRGYALVRKHSGNTNSNDPDGLRAAIRLL